MPAYPNPFNESSLGQVFRGIANEWFNPPERQRTRLLNELTQQQIEDNNRRVNEKALEDAKAAEFWDAYKELTVPKPAPTTAGAYAPDAGGVGPYLEQGATPMEAAKEPMDLLSAVLTDPNLGQLAIEGNVLNLPGVISANESRLTREDNQQFRTEQAAQGHEYRMELARQNAAARAQQEQINAQNRLNYLQMQLQGRMAELQAKQNDPLARAKIQADIERIRAQMQTEEARAGYYQAQAGLVTAKTQNPAAFRGGAGGAALDVGGNDMEALSKGLAEFEAQTGIKMTPEDRARALAVMGGAYQDSRNMPEVVGSLGEMFNVTPEETGVPFWPFDNTDATYSFNPPGGAAPAAAPAGPVSAVPEAVKVAPQQAQIGLPPEAAARLKPGVVTTFGNGQRWTIQNGKPTQVQ